MDRRDEAVNSWWSSAALDRVWAVVADRLERNALLAHGRCVVKGLDREERHALGNLLGRSITTEEVTIDLARLDQRLTSRASMGLVHACEHALGRALADRQERSALDRARRAAPGEAAERWLSDHPDLDWPWVPTWLEGLRRDSLLGRDGDPTALVTTALEVLGSRRGTLAQSEAGVSDPPHFSEPPVSRADLAARLCHDAHGLDDDRRLGSVVLRAVALAIGAAAPVDARSRRDLWSALGVVVDSVSATCLVWGLTLVTPPGDQILSSALAHLTWWHLRSGVQVSATGRVLICENPRVLEAVAQSGRSDIGVVCTSGRANLPTQEVLGGLSAAGAPLIYHGDFDWPGIAMANDAVARFGASAFRMSCADYDRMPGAVPLKGRPLEPSWDAELGASMRRRGVAVHEEAVIDDLIEAL